MGVSWDGYDGLDAFYGYEIAEADGHFDALIAEGAGDVDDVTHLDAVLVGYLLGYGNDVGLGEADPGDVFGDEDAVDDLDVRMAVDEELGSDAADFLDGRVEGGDGHQEGH